jgi:hypothetical protein
MVGEDKRQTRTAEYAGDRNAKMYPLSHNSAFANHQNAAASSLKKNLIER